MRAFIDTRAVWGCEELETQLANLNEGTGTFACLLGGRDTGKSNVLRIFSTKDKNNAFIVDLRCGYSSITKGVIHVLAQSKNADLKHAFKQVYNIIKREFGALTRYESDPLIGFGRILVTYPSLQIYLLHEVLSEMSKVVATPITLVIDEANILFSVDQYTSQERIHEARAILPMLIGLTRQDHKVEQNCIILIKFNKSFILFALFTFIL